MESNEKNDVSVIINSFIKMIDKASSKDKEK